MFHLFHSRQVRVERSGRGNPVPPERQAPLNQPPRTPTGALRMALETHRIGPQLGPNIGQKMRSRGI